jgi:hypothetical protein
MWKLNVEKSTFGTILFPGPPPDFRVLAQTLRIEQVAKGITISGDTTFSAGGGSDTSHDGSTLSLDGMPTNVGDGYASLSFRRIYNSAFEIITALTVPNTNVGEVGRYVFSSDGSELTAT